VKVYVVKNVVIRKGFMSAKEIVSSTLRKFLMSAK